MDRATLNKMYLKYVPRWIRCIRWQDQKERWIWRQKYTFMWLYFPVFFVLMTDESQKLSRQLWWHRPKNEEELNTVLRNIREDPYYIDFGYGEYVGDTRPVYDLHERRKAYPEYYGTKYDGKQSRPWVSDFPIERKGKEAPKYY